MSACICVCVCVLPVCLSVLSLLVTAASLIGVDRSSTSSSCASNSFSTPRNTPTSSSRLSPLTPKSPSERCVKSSSGSLQFFYSEDEQGSAESSLDSEELAAQASGARHAPLATAEATRGEDYSELVQVRTFGHCLYLAC